MSSKKRKKKEGPGHPALPVAKAIRKSRRGRWRAAVLILVHLIAAAHIAHFMSRGETISPVEPSESMYTLELGELNAGFLFFVVALLLTAVFGRFFCGWGCHLVALQDLCGWMMKRLGVKPRPFRSRLMVWFPLGLALYMFVWPTAKRWLMTDAPAFPGFTNQLTTSGFWDTFPGPLFIVLTFLTCGFLVVYLLGAKGFCTYACPYGGFFGLMDGLSPGRIVVNDDCEQCGHCTATCTSNVLVHDEVRRFGTVVDPGCMKCTDCVSVCPKGALSFGFTRPAWFRRSPTDTGPRRYPLSWKAEGILAAIALGSILAYRGLYDGPPLLMSVALGVMTAFLALRVWQTLFGKQSRLQNLTLKSGGKLGAAGVVLLVVGILWLAFTAHSGFAQWHRAWGRYHLNQTEATRADVLSGVAAGRVYTASHDRAAARSFRHFRLAQTYGLLPTVEVELGVAWGYLLQGRDDQALATIRRTIQQHPDRSQLYRNLFDYQAGRQDLFGAIATRRQQIEHDAATWQERLQFGSMLVQGAETDEAISVFRGCIDEEPDRVEARYNLGGLLRRLGRGEEAIVELEAASALTPRDPDIHVELGLAYQATGRPALAAERIREAIALAPGRPESLEYLPQLVLELEAAASSQN
ncbi:MAG: tetratricopeptide repeat protein [Acidobacteriota bacterium]|nr:tetratricopeptide repeat protein [Acidobacteriota bacterium]MDH3784858.1 tetratricopeptide repeat protein [Acidobacteriota bacterium]